MFFPRPNGKRRCGLGIRDDYVARFLLTTKGMGDSLKRDCLMSFFKATGFGILCISGLFVLSDRSLADFKNSNSETASQSIALEYLERTEGKSKRYLAPSEIDERFNIAIYVNANRKGSNAQRLWVLQRDVEHGKFKLAMWDERWWKSKPARKKYKIKPGQTPPFSWLVSTGRKWRGDKRSGPTSLGVFTIDERQGRTQRGWHARGMKHVMYIDYHYRSGRRSGIAFHGTSRGQYRKLGSVASHGCIRMHQSNALKLLKRIRGWDNVLSEKRRWGTVPRFWKRERNSKRYGYVRDGSLLAIKPSITTTGADAEQVPSGDGGVIHGDTAKRSSVLTKAGFRAITVIFKD